MNLHLVAQAKPQVCAVPDAPTVVRALDGRYLVQLTRHNGSSYAGVFFTKDQLTQLVVAAAEALATNPP